MSPTLNVCRKCGQKLPAAATKTGDQRAAVRSQSGQSAARKQQHRGRAVAGGRPSCAACAVRVATKRHILAPPKNADSSAAAATHGGRVVKRGNRSRWHHVQRQEFQKLRKMLPSLQQKEKVSKLELIEEAIRYIEELHSALVKRFKDRGFPPILNSLNVSPHDIDGDSIGELIRKLLVNVNPGSLPPTRIENIRTTPSFLLKATKSKKT